jgi:signal transduction histidine kinase
VIIAFALGLCMSLMLKSLDQTRSNNKILRQARDAARKSETEAHDAAATFKSMNEDITVLNIRLTQKAAELEAAQKEIVRKAKMAQLGVLVSTVAHELRNPLSVVRTTAFVLQRKLIGASVDAKEHLGRIDSGIKRCDTIISQLLDFTRAQDAVTSPTDLDSWLENILGSECDKLPPAIEITCNLGLNGHMVNIDADRMQRVVINLLNNAAEAMCPRGVTCPDMVGRTPRIDVGTRRTMRGAEISVADNGPGIHAHFIEKIREPLFTTKGFGTGLGIPAAEKIIELHGGGLDISSTLGQGAVFTLWIPLQQQKRVA